MTTNKPSLSDYGLNLVWKQPTPGVEPLGVSDRVWPHVKWEGTLSKGKASYTFTYKCGIGHYEQAKKSWERPRKSMTPEEQAQDATRIAIARRQPPESMLVLNCLCRDGASAFSNTFESWCSDYGFEPDSLKAYGIYRECVEIYKQLSCLLSPKQIEEVAQLEY